MTIEAIHRNHTTYTHNAGILSLRTAISNYVKERYQLDYHPEEEILVTVGASEAIAATLKTILDQGDEVILPGPVYPGYEPLITLNGAKAVYVDTRQSKFKLTAELIEPMITSRTKAILIPYPSNPTGVTLSEEELKAIASLLDDKDIFLIADEIYSELIYEKDHFSIGRCRKIKDKTIIINGVSKSHSMTGFRIGYILGPAWLIQHILKVHQYYVSCATSVSQYAALEALTNGKNDAEVMRDAYRERRDFVYKRLVEMGISTYLPDGGFYYFIPLSSSSKSSLEIALELVEKERLALVPGSAFSKYGEGYLRLSYAYDLDTLKKRFK